MAKAVTLSDELLGKAQTQARALHRSTAAQIDYWAKIGRLAEDNPELSYAFIKDLLVAMEEEKNQGTTPYVLGEGQ